MHMALPVKNILVFAPGLLAWLVCVFTNGGIFQSFQKIIVRISKA